MKFVNHTMELLISILILMLWLTLPGSSMGFIRKPLNNFDVVRFGAVGNGVTDDSKAFLAAWKVICGLSSHSSRLIIPPRKTFLLYPTKFSGPCKPHQINFQIWGNIVAPNTKSAWYGNHISSWLSFEGVNGLVVNGRGRIDGRGHVWWNLTSSSDGVNGQRPTALHFNRCNDLVVKGLKHINSQKNHISINHCNGATISNLHISAPRTSPNTDGIDISGSTNIQVLHTNIATGDDCIAINGGCSNINITGVECGPGHGISIGSLGAHGKYDQVEEIHVQGCSFTGTQNGVRIKTWQGGSGYARNISFTGITFNAANNPILIDQYYCPHSSCNNQTSAVEVSDISYSGVQGTSIKPAAINLLCSQSVPCTNILLDHVSITSTVPQNSTYAHCINAHGRSFATTPAVNCLMN